MFENIITVFLHMLSVSLMAILSWIFGVWIIKLPLSVFIKGVNANKRIDLIAGAGSLLFLIFFAKIGSPYR